MQDQFSICSHCAAPFTPWRKNSNQQYCSRLCARRGGANRVPPSERIAMRTVAVDGCLLWTGARNRQGYGHMTIDGQRLLVHRVMWELAHGPIPAGMLACHKCDTPLCVNPDHLFLGSHADNSADMATKGRHFSHTRPERIARGERSGQTHLTAENIREIRGRREGGATMYALGREYGVSRQAIRRIVCREVWVHIE